MSILHKITKDQFGEKNIHNVCRELFDSHVNPVRSLELVTEKGISYLILDVNESRKDGVFMRSIPKYSQGDEVGITVKVCYEYRRDHSRGRIMDEEDAIEKFISHSGLYPVEGTSISVKKIKYLGKFSTQGKAIGFKNCFEISGKFTVEDSEIFNNALENGVGTRGSYGFGLILTDKILDKVA